MGMFPQEGTFLFVIASADPSCPRPRERFQGSFAAFRREMDRPLLSFLVLEGGRLPCVRKAVALYHPLGTQQGPFN